MAGGDPAAPAPPRIPGVVGVGVDIIEIERVREAAARGGARFLQRVFSEGERAYCLSKREPGRHLAARFAAKEAAIKALRVPPGLGWLWGDIEVVRSEGPPSIRLAGRAAARARDLGVTGSHLSISHSETHAVAIVVLT